MNTGSDFSRSSGELDLMALARNIWRDRWLIIALTAAAGGAGVAYSLLATEWFEAQVVMVPVEGSALPAGLSQLGSLASLAGINLNAGGEDREPLAVLRSREFAAEFIEKENLIPVFFADEWDAARQKWRDDDPDEQMDVRDAVKYFGKKVRRVSVEDETGLITLSILWKDPDEAARWANLFVTEINGRLRSQALKEAERNIKYLTETMANSNIMQLQQPLGRVLESEMQTMMLARGRDEFAFKVVDRAVTPKERAKPKRALVSVMSAMLGCLLGLLIVFVRRSNRR